MSNYELNAHKKSDTVKWVVAFTLIFALILGMAASIYIGLDNRQEEEVPATEGSTAPALQANTVSEAGIRLMSARTTDVSPAATGTDDSVTITATLTANASSYDDTVLWTVQFKDYSSAWASGKDVADYVTMTVSSDTHSVQIDCNAAFGEPIIVTAVSKDNSTCKATCQLDYVKRITSVTDFYLNEEAASGTSYKNYMRFAATNTVTASVEFGDGTITPELAITSMSIPLSSTIQGLINDNIFSSGMSAKSSISLSVAEKTAEGNTVTGSFAVAISDLYSGSGEDNALNNWVYTNAFTASTGGGAPYMNGTPTIQISVRYGGVAYQNFQYTHTEAIRFERGNLHPLTSVTALEVDPKSFVF